MKKIGYRIFALIYYICTLLPRKKNKVFAIMTHDASDGSNVGVMILELQKRGGYHIVTLGKEERDQMTKQRLHKVWSLLDFFFAKPYHMATCSIILQDNLFLPMAYMKFPKSVKVIQLWHGTGTIKKFGQSVNEGELGALEKAADQTITHLIINGPATHAIYREAFGVDDSKVYELGLPRTDVLFDDEVMRKKVEEFYRKYPLVKGKRFVLYAPTFRDSEVSDPKLGFDLVGLLSELPEDMVLGLKLHPFVARSFHGLELPENLKERVIDLSLYSDTNQLLAVADVLITDYSSIIFEYCIQEKPMIFYAYDFEDFKKNQRGFYQDYESFVPGQVVYNQEQLVNALKHFSVDEKRLEEFVKLQYRYLDGKAAQRIVDKIIL